MTLEGFWSSFINRVNYSWRCRDMRQRDGRSQAAERKTPARLRVWVCICVCKSVHTLLLWIMFRLKCVVHSLPSLVLPPSGWSHPDRNLSLSHWFCWNLFVRSSHPSGPAGVREIFISRQRQQRRFHSSLAKTGEIHNSLKHTALTFKQATKAETALTVTQKDQSQ